LTRFGRYKLSEISGKRLFSALKARTDEIPHSLAWNLDPYARENRDRIRAYKGKHQGRRCFIVANGPSLAQTKLDLLKNEVTFGLNRIYLYFDQTSFRPTYFAAVNELILEQFSSEIRQLNMPKFLNWNRRSFYDTNDLDTLFLKSRMVMNDAFQNDLTRPLVVGGTVTFVALQMAYYMGFRTVVLIGLDHKYVDKGTPSGTEVRTANKDQSHFHPEYFPKGSKWQLPDLLRSEIDFEIARKAFELDGREIVDATIDGHCQIFKKVSYSSLFDQG
jgi:hypothetical protein